MRVLVGLRTPHGKQYVPLRRYATASVPRVFNAPRFVPSADAQPYLRKVPPTTVSSLPNGFRVACESIPDSQVATVGVWIDAGSRYETLANNGTAHFLEHMNFKGTHTMTKNTLERKFEEIGGHLNAYTARDRTSYYVKVFKRYVPEAIAILADILRNSKIPERDIKRERSTILEEMKEVELLVDEVVMDHLHIASYQTSSLGLTILGPEKNISSVIDREMIVNFVKQHYTGPRMVLVGAGAVEHTQLEGLAKKYFGDLPSNVDKGENAPAVYTGGQYTMWSKDLPAVHLAAAFPTCGIGNDDVYTLQVIQHLVGSYTKNNRELLSKQRFRAAKCIGLSVADTAGKLIGTEPDPRVEVLNPFYTPYVDTGLMGVYLVAYPGDGNIQHHLNRIVSLFGELSSTLLEENDMQLAKSNLKAALVLNVDGTTNVAEDIGRQLLHNGKRIPLTDYFTAIDAVTPEDVRRVMGTYFQPNGISLSTVGPVRNTDIALGKSLENVKVDRHLSEISPVPSLEQIRYF
ncbi:mitochondrial processing peptide beta subunit [Perkinsela sp. CCAP 1560/4]|nr:mitochondrial processing peptide beta subunit [Perkinsela sp. CCAP 1560/4]|eukprot:KNH07501.1 mitochondrial processing peptide beta subunit [Perkinsela sp. CCAP 1560/4]